MKGMNDLWIMSSENKNVISSDNLILFSLFGPFLFPPASICKYFGSSFADLTSEKRSNYVTVTRYITYLGLCIATCVIFQSSTWLAALVGIAVACYISLSEYWLSSATASDGGGGGGGGAFGPSIPDQLAAQVKDSLGF